MTETLKKGFRRSPPAPKSKENHTQNNCHLLISQHFFPSKAVPVLAAGWELLPVTSEQSPSNG